MDVTPSQLVDTLVLPPGGPLLLAFLGLLLWKIGFGRRLFLFAFLLLWIFSMPVTEEALLAGLETYPALSEAQLKQSDTQAIVVMGARRYLGAPEYGGDTAGPSMLMRVRYAARLARLTGLPVIPSGGVTENTGKAEANIYAEILQEDYGITSEQRETASRNTWENARYTAQLMQKLGIEKVLLVTDAAHMRRAMYSFEHNGAAAIPAPTGFRTHIRPRLSWLRVMPNANALANSAYALHEYLGLLWYRFKHP